ALLAALLGRDVGLEEALVAAGLDLGQVGDRVVVVDAAEVAGGRWGEPSHAGRAGHRVALLQGRCWARGRSGGRDVQVPAPPSHGGGGGVPGAGPPGRRAAPAGRRAGLGGARGEGGGEWWGDKGGLPPAPRRGGATRGAAAPVRSGAGRVT